MINCMKTTMNEQKRFAFVSKDAKSKGDKVVFKKKKKKKKKKKWINLVSYSLSSSSKDINYLYLPVMENFHEWLKTFLDKTIRDAEDPVYNYNNVRTEMDITTQMIAQTK
ncbi:hypothetical protein H8356DRAFT_1088329 [Neocallimastix lanati (nom. inval.)]|nr:hypothetical protein H8356DRAFT_1088329 [Neocallimastix sp. JGI-2020a]